MERLKIYFAWNLCAHGVRYGRGRLIKLRKIKINASAEMETERNERCVGGGDERHDYEKEKRGRSDKIN